MDFVEIVALEFVVLHMDFEDIRNLDVCHMHFVEIVVLEFVALHMDFVHIVALVLHIVLYIFVLVPAPEGKWLLRVRRLIIIEHIYSSFMMMPTT